MASTGYPIDTGECDPCGKRRARAALSFSSYASNNVGIDTTACVFCCTFPGHPVGCGECGDPITEAANPLGLCAECADFFAHEICEEHPCSDCAARAIDAAFEAARDQESQFDERPDQDFGSDLP